MGKDLSQKDNIHNGHRERVRRNVSENGYSQLEDHRLLELLLFYSVPRGDTNGIAHELLNAFGSLSGVFSASVDDLVTVNGVGKNTAIYLKAIHELNMRIANEPIKNHKSFKTAEALFELARSLYFCETNEKSYILCFDSAMRLQRTVLIGEGVSDEVEIDQRKMTQAVLSSNAIFAVLVHNHPNSSELPSENDYEVTRATALHFRRIGVALYDHIIVGEDGKCFAYSSENRFNVLDVKPLKKD